MRLFLARHAKAAPGHPDELRPLTPDGRDQARSLGAELAVHRPDTVITSPLLRARETAAEIARVAAAELRVDERLAPGATLEDLLDAIADAGEVVVAVGHQPDCSELAEALGAGDVPFAPGAVHELVLE
jgi:phosphohistidine phosphatase SixA